VPAGIDLLMERLKSARDDERYSALTELLAITEEKVPWFAEYREGLAAKLADANSYQRSIGAMLLANLAKSEGKKGEFGKLLPALMGLVDDEKFITERQYLQSVWKVALVDPAYEKRIVAQLKSEFAACAAKKHANLLRLDIVAGLAKIMAGTGKAGMRREIEALIATEEGEKERKNTQPPWRRRRASSRFGSARCEWALRGPGLPCYQGIKPR